MFHALSDSAFLEKLYKEKYKDVYKLAFYTLKKYPFASLDAADITQEVFICAAQHIDVLRRHPNPTGWLYKTTCYVCKNRLRNGASSREQLFADLSLHEEVSDTFPYSNMIISLQQTLSPEDYALVKAYYIDEKPIDEICADTNLTPNALRVRIHRIKKYLSAFFVFLVIIFQVHNI